MAQQHTEQGDMKENDIPNRAICKKAPQFLRRYYNSQTLEHIEGLHLCVLPLANERQYDIGGLFLGLAIHLDDEIVVTSVVA